MVHVLDSCGLKRKRNVRPRIDTRNFPTGVLHATPRCFNSVIGVIGMRLTRRRMSSAPERKSATPKGGDRCQAVNDNLHNHTSTHPEKAIRGQAAVRFWTHWMRRLSDQVVFRVLDNSSDLLVKMDEMPRCRALPFPPGSIKSMAPRFSVCYLPFRMLTTPGKTA